jgi:hypothetical protein
MPIAQSYQQARDQTERLVARFARNLDVYRRPAYKEAQVRAEFINLTDRRLHQRRINALVYELYDLTDDEIAIVEAAAG